MIMRVSVGIHKENIDKVIETYDLMSQRLFTHATPTLFNAGTPKPQMSSCFLLTMKEDSISGIYDTLKQVGGVRMEESTRQKMKEQRETAVCVFLFCFARFVRVRRSSRQDMYRGEHAPQEQRAQRERRMCVLCILFCPFCTPERRSSRQAKTCREESTRLKRKEKSEKIHGLTLTPTEKQVLNTTAVRNSKEYHTCQKKCLQLLRCFFCFFLPCSVLHCAEHNLNKYDQKLPPTGRGCVVNGQITKASNR